jgi:hypothetical protein
MLWGGITNSHYCFNKPVEMLRKPNAWRLALSDIKAARIHLGSHYEIAFFTDLPSYAFTQRLNLLGEKKCWFAQMGELVEFGWTYNFLDRLSLELSERSARKLISRTGGKLLGLSIYSPEFAHAQTH